MKLQRKERKLRRVMLGHAVRRKGGSRKWPR